MTATLDPVELRCSNKKCKRLICKVASVGEVHAEMVCPRCKTLTQAVLPAAD